MCFVYLENAFKRLTLEALWLVLRRFRGSMKFANLIRQFHVGIKAQVQHENELSGKVQTTSEVEHDCVIA